MPYLNNTPTQSPQEPQRGIRKYRMIQEIEITIYPNGACYPKTLWSKIKDTEVEQANQRVNIKKKETAKKNLILEAKEKAERIEKETIKSDIKEEKQVLF